MTPLECWKAAGGGTPEYDGVEWRRLMLKNGYVVPSPEPEPRKRHLTVVATR